MDNSLFSILVYRLIGKPEAWHQDYIDVMNEVLDETDSFEVPDKFLELEIGDQILNKLSHRNKTFAAFSALLNKSRFKMIILDENFEPVYHNQNAASLFQYLLDVKDTDALRPGLICKLRTAIQPGDRCTQGELQLIDFKDRDKNQLYLKSINNQAEHNSADAQFHVLMGLDQSREHNPLNAELISKYELTDKEQKIVRGLIHGKGIKAISQESFISENTVKTHLKAIFRKTGSNSQSDVVRLILTHESQILDSYFASEIGSAAPASKSTNSDLEVTLASGNRIVYREYGPPDGRPLIVFHSGYGCRLSIPPDYQKACERTNRRLIIADRPGIGQTPFIAGHPDGWNARLQEFIDLLGLQQYDILGSIFGCQLAVAFASEADHRLQKIILNSPVVVNERSHTKYLTGILAPTARLVRSSKRFAREIYELWLKSVTLNLDSHYPKMLDSTLGSAEREQFMNDGTFESLIDTFKEGARHSLKGIAHEMVYCLSPLNIDQSKITVPVEVWYGTEDQRISLQGAQAGVENFPNLRMHIREGYSEHIYYALFEEIIA